MRDPERIPRMLQMLEVLWLAYPDLRLGQIIVNAMRPHDDHSVFYVEDDVIERGIDAMTDYHVKRALSRAAEKEAERQAARRKP
jgi:hypothetical protein